MVHHALQLLFMSSAFSVMLQENLNRHLPKNSNVWCKQWHRMNSASAKPRTVVSNTMLVRLPAVNATLSQYVVILKTFELIDGGCIRAVKMQKLREKSLTVYVFNTVDIRVHRASSALAEKSFISFRRFNTCIQPLDSGGYTTSPYGGYIRMWLMALMSWTNERIYPPKRQSGSCDKTHSRINQQCEMELLLLCFCVIVFSFWSFRL